MGSKDGSKIRGRHIGKASAKKQEVKGQHLSIEVHGGVREELGMNTYLHGPMDYANELQLRFCVWDLDLPERKGICQSSSGGERRCTHVPLWQISGE